MTIPSRLRRPESDESLDCSMGHSQRKAQMHEGQGSLTEVWVQHWIEPVLHWDESRATSPLGAAAATAARAATGRRAEERMYMLLVVALGVDLDG